MAATRYNTYIHERRVRGPDGKDRWYYTSSENPLFFCDGVTGDWSGNERYIEDDSSSAEHLILCGMTSGREPKSLKQLTIKGEEIPEFEISRFEGGRAICVKI